MNFVSVPFLLRKVHPASHSNGTGFFPVCEAPGPEVNLSPYLTSRLRIYRNTNLLILHVFVAWKETTVQFCSLRCRAVSAVTFCNVDLTTVD